MWAQEEVLGSKHSGSFIENDKHFKSKKNVYFVVLVIG